MSAHADGPAVGSLADLNAPAQAPPRADLLFLSRRVRPARTRALNSLAPAVQPPPLPSRPPAPTKPAPPSIPTGLDLSSAAPPVSPVSSGPTTSSTPPGRSLLSRTIRPARIGERTLLSPAEPVVRLDRLQSGVGVLTFDAAVSSAVGDLRVGCAYELAGGVTSTVQHGGGASSAPQASRSPVIVGRNDGFERLLLDLRQNRAFHRMIIYGLSESGQALRWGGTLIVTALGGARIELPLDLPESTGAAVFMSVYNVDGEFVIRAEMEVVSGSLRDACVTYGFDRITWLDGNQPVS